MSEERSLVATVGRGRLEVEDRGTIELLNGRPSPIQAGEAGIGRAAGTLVPLCFLRCANCMKNGRGSNSITGTVVRSMASVLNVAHQSISMQR